MRKIRDRLVAAVFAVFLAGPALILCAGIAHVPLPSWFTAEDAKQLAGGVVHGDIVGNLSVRGFAEGDLQVAIERVVGNRVPCKAAAMLANGQLQRAAIETSNSLFGWSCYPTYFGSTCLRVVDADADTFLPKKSSKTFVKRLTEFSKGVRQAAERHPEKRFIVYLVQGYQTPGYNPAYELVSNPKTARIAEDIFSENLAGLDNLFFCTNDYGSSSDYFTDFYRTDHHWTYKGAMRAYNTIAHALGLPQFDSPGEIGFDDYRYMGSTARTGLDDNCEAVYDTSHDFSYLATVNAEGEKRPYSHDAFFGKSEQERRYSFYTDYYNFLPTGSAILNDRADGASLLISDSYRGGLQQYLAEQYGSTAISAHLHESKGHSKITEQSRLDTVPGFADADDVFLVSCPDNMAKLVKNCPDYFDAV